MDVREEILREHSKAQCNKIVAWVGSSQQRFDKLFWHFMHDEYRVVQRSAWPISYCVENHPILIKKHLGELIKRIQEPEVHDAVKRNGTRLLQHVAIPEKFEGEIMDFCFRFLSAPAETIACKVFSLKVLQKLAKKYPEIVPEVLLVIDDLRPHAGPGIKCAIREFEASLKKC